MSKKDLTQEEILHLAKLANLQLSDAEVKKYQEQIGETLDYVKNLEELDTKKISETHSVTSLKNVFFEDGTDCERMLSQEEAVSNAKNKKDGNFVVKRIM